MKYFHDGLSVRAANILRYLKLLTKNDVRKILASQMGADYFLTTRGCGKKTAQEIINWASLPGVSPLMSMTLRELYAGFAMMGLLVSKQGLIDNEIVGFSFRLADAMIAEDEAHAKNVEP